MVLERKRYILIISVLTTVCLFILGFDSNSENNLKIVQQKYDYTGTNALFVQIGSKLQFNWITDNKDEGFFELRDKDNIIQSGTTAASRVHQVEINAEIDKNLSFKFGGANEEQFEVSLRKPDSNLKATYKNADSIYVVGDVHGRYEELMNLLKKSKIIDEDLHWIAGQAHLVFLGDIFDRGDAVTRVLWFIYNLEAEAEKVNGRVHLVLGNHEIMVMTKDLRYLSAKERNIAIGYKVDYNTMFHPQTSLLGRWLAGKPSVLKIDDFLFAHGGIVELNTNSLDEYNETVARYMEDPIFLEITNKSPDSTQYDASKWYEMRYFFYYEDGPFWYRGYVNQDTLDVQLTDMLKKYNSKVHIVAHTPVPTILERYNGKLLATDLNDAATELLFLKRKKRNFDSFKIDSQGVILELN